MTREEALNILHNASVYHPDYLDALNMAIKALEQEPCEDAISRQAVLDLVNSDWKYEGLETDVASLPFVNPQETKEGHWIGTAEEYYKAVNEYGGGVNEYTQYFVDDIACSVCLALYSVIDNETERFDFCPSCGCRMEGGAE